MKLFSDWHKSAQCLSVFYAPGDTVDEELYDYLLGVVFPASFGRHHVQCGEPSDHGGTHARARYITVARQGDGLPWVYLGAREFGHLSM